MPRVRLSPDYCFLTHAVVEAMVREAADRAPDETGGVLLGVSSDSGVWVQSVIGPGRNAIHRRTSFVPDAEFQRLQIGEAYTAAGRRLEYLGDWHSHPQTAAYLSKIDVKTLRGIAKHKEARQPRPVMAIVAGGDPWRLAVWRLRQRHFFVKRTPEALRIVVE